MKLGTSSPLSHLSPAEWAKRHRSLGLEAINFPLSCEDSRDRIDAYAAAAKEQGLVIAEVGIWKNTLDPDEDRRREAIRYAIGQLELADSLHARCAVNILGARGPRWDGAYRENYLEETFELGVRTIREIIDAARPQHTFFTIEPMPWMIPDGPDSYLKLLEAVDRSRFAVHLDVFNWMTSPRRYFFCEEFISECFDKLGSLTRSCHLKDVSMEENYTLYFRETFPGGGGVNIRHLLQEASRTDADMPVIIEHLNTDEEYLKAIAYVQSL